MSSILISQGLDVLHVLDLAYIARHFAAVTSAFPFFWTIKDYSHILLYVSISN